MSSFYDALFFFQEMCPTDFVVILMYKQLNYIFDFRKKEVRDSDSSESDLESCMFAKLSL